MDTFDRPTYLISDLHFFHGNIIRYCHRPYVLAGKKFSENKEVLDQMTEDILQKFDELPDNIDIWNLGDLFFTGRKEKLDGFIEKYFDEMKNIVTRMRGNGRRLFLILGNHDTLHNDGDTLINFYKSLGFDGVFQSPYKIGNIILSHRPFYISMEEPEKVNYYGHTHDLCIEKDYFTYDYDNYAMIKRCADIDNIEMPEIVQQWPAKLVNLEQYHNVCYDYTGGFTKIN